MDEEYYLRFPSVLKKALQSKRVSFPENLKTNYEPLPVFRGIRYIVGKKEQITKEDFLSQAEREIPGTNFDDIGSYSCSCFENVEELVAARHLPKKNKAIAKGEMCYELGARVDDSHNTHRHWYLYNDADPSEKFEVYPYEYEKMD